jgi:hypothetical protein
MDQVIGQVLHPAHPEPAVLVNGPDDPDEPGKHDTVEQVTVHQDDLAATGVPVSTDLDAHDQANGKPGRGGRRRNKKESESRPESDADAAAGPTVPFTDDSMYLPPQEG